VRAYFMGFFPTDNPQIAILVILDEPQRDKWGGVAAAPVFKNIGEQIVTCFRTPLRRDTLPPRETELTETGLKLVSASSAAPEQTPPISEDAESVMPDFHGMTIRDVMRKARKMSIEIKIAGSGWAADQEPAAGTPIGDFPSCKVSFEN
ncbi:MAG: penicillin-binding transpeptidase domain-containing protein, partial [Syntrophales bacterium]|nr:penicillin-binding transpeptidase domain-containing protein [Syntrophales bacterium]